MNMSTDNLISVIIPCYNVEKYLERCINSIIAQIYKNLQIILINDGSTDNSLEICKKFAGQDQRIEVIDKENGGLSDARNAGIERARGEYICFIDSDDFVHERYIVNMYAHIKRDNPDMCICGFNFVAEDDILFPEMILDTLESFPDFAGLREGVYSPATVMKTISATPLVVAWNKLYRRELFENIRFPVGRLHEDEFVIHHLVDACNLISVTPDRLYFYVQRDSGITGVHFNIRRLDVLDAYEERLKFYLEKSNYDLIQCTCLGYIRRYVEAFIKLPRDNQENILRLKECRENLFKHRKPMFKYGGFKIGLRYLLATRCTRIYQAISGLRHHNGDEL